MALSSSSKSAGYLQRRASGCGSSWSAARSFAGFFLWIACQKWNEMLTPSPASTSGGQSQLRADGCGISVGREYEDGHEKCRPLRCSRLLVSTLVGEISRIVVEPASSSLRSGVSSPNGNRARSGCFFGCSLTGGFSTPAASRAGGAGLFLRCFFKWITLP